MAVGLFGMSVAVLTLLVSRRRVLLGLVVLSVGVMVGRLRVMVCGGVMVCCGLPMVLDGRVFGLRRHGHVLLQGFGKRARRAHGSAAVSPLVSEPALSVRGSPGHG
jgi:hypothetical protein